MSRKKKIVLTVLWGLFCAIAVFGVVLSVKTLIFNHQELSVFLKTHLPDFVWCRVLKENIALLYVVLFILLVNLSVAVLNLINCIKTKSVACLSDNTTEKEI